MSKALSKLLSLFLSVTMLSALPVFSRAEGEHMDITDAKIVAAAGDWKTDYVEKITITLFCAARSLSDDGILLTVSLNSADNVIKSVSKSDLKAAKIFKDRVEITFNFNETVNHADSYIFEICEGALKNFNGETNSAFSFSSTGNLIVESLEKEEEALNPIQRFIRKLRASRFAVILTPVIMLLEWFDSL